MRRLRQVLAVLILASLAAAMSGCVNVTAPSQLGERVRRAGAADRWPVTDGMMATDDAWLEVTRKGKGRVKGYSTGEAQITDGGPGSFILFIIEESEGVPVKRMVQIDYERDTKVYVEDAYVGTVPQGLVDDREFYDITTGDRVLTVDFVMEGERLRATRINASGIDPLAPNPR